ncbi:hypothetical protein O9992_21785 [Vibrio lentus]|nr:hypothetical protein [Vibrio lentus]
MASKAQNFAMRVPDAIALECHTAQARRYASGDQITTKWRNDAMWY